MKMGRPSVRAAAALALYVALAAIYTHPLLVQARDGIANDRYDPVLNASSTNAKETARSLGEKRQVHPSIARRS